MLTEFLLRCVISGSIACILYLISAGIMARLHGRKVTRDIVKHDVKLGFISLLFGSPVLQVFAVAHEKWGISRIYPEIAEKGWLWWALSLPLYVLLWDATFYLTHLVLHHPFVFRVSHFRHHKCRPPVPWSGIAIDPVETILSGIMPYVVPLFILPFHVYTVYALNIMLMVWATLVHSAYDWTQSPIFMTPKDHNLHHHFGLKNANFAAVFTFWDRIFGTLNRTDRPPWWGIDNWVPKVGVPARGAQTEGAPETVADTAT
jgi:sterol desaturase/sphingolipid hydroxylase (fatty acid hydroxylase superfamily)